MAMSAWCQKLMDKCESELEALSKKPDLDDNGLARLKRWTQSLSALETIKAMRESYPDGYAPRNYGAAPYRDAHVEAYGHPFGWGRMAYYGDMSRRADWPRDSYGGHDSMTLPALRRMMDTAVSDKERDAIRRAIRDIESA